MDLLMEMTVSLQVRIDSFNYLVLSNVSSGFNFCSITMKCDEF